MTVLLAIAMVVALGIWIPLAQLRPETPPPIRLLYVAVGNAVFSAGALLLSGARPAVGWRTFWLPLAGGLVWMAGNYCVFRASELVGLARAAGTWTPLNIVVAFVWGSLLFGELDAYSGVKIVALAAAFLAVVAGVLLIASSQDDPVEPPSSSARPLVASPPSRRATTRAGFWWAGAAGILWGSYFVPAQWSAVPAQVSNFPLALGILIGALALALSAREPISLDRRATSQQVGAGVLFGVGNLALLAVVARIGTGTGFTIAQLSLAVNAGIGIWVFHRPAPGTRQARRVLTGIAIAGLGGSVIAAMR
jgi:glucose uptake protein GlcU